MDGLVDLYRTLSSNNISQSLKEELSTKLFEFQTSRTRKITMEEMLALQQQNHLLDQIKNSIKSKKTTTISKDIQQTFQTNKDFDSSISFCRTDKDASFLLQTSMSSKRLIPTSPRSRINRRGTFVPFDLETVLDCVRNNFGFETSQTLRSMVNSGGQSSNTKYKTLYEREKTAHQTTELNRRQMSARISKLELKIEQLEKDAAKEQLEKKNVSKQLSMLQAKQSKLNKLETKLLIKQKMLKQQQKHLETLKFSIRKQKEMLENQCVSIEESYSQNETLQVLKVSLEKRRKSCRDFEDKLQQQFFSMGELISRLEDSDPYNI